MKNKYVVTPKYTPLLSSHLLLFIILIFQKNMLKIKIDFNKRVIINLR